MKSMRVGSELIQKQRKSPRKQRPDLRPQAKTGELGANSDDIQGVCFQCPRPHDHEAEIVPSRNQENGTI